MLNTIWGIVYRNEVPDPLMPPSDSPNLVLSGDLPGSVDAAHAHDLRNRRSTTGFAFMLAGGAVSYRSKTQSITATSSTEANFWRQSLLPSMQSICVRSFMSLASPNVLPRPSTKTTYMSALNMINARVPIERSRHIDIQYFAIQDWKDRGDIIMRHIPHSRHH